MSTLCDSESFPRERGVVGRSLPVAVLNLGVVPLCFGYEEGVTSGFHSKSVVQNRKVKSLFVSLSLLLVNYSRIING